MNTVNVQFTIMNNMRWSFSRAPEGVEPGVQRDRSLVFRVVNVPPAIEAGVIVDLVATVPTEGFLLSHDDLLARRGRLIDVAA
ncbi:hypothetical protein [Oceanibaculum nanhaiense]|uniref:hypothetical protein n=1 Tax=Oceanibaculum nanhaiense TaxID=1909734 RepID=UPI003D2DF563